MVVQKVVPKVVQKGVQKGGPEGGQERWSRRVVHVSLRPIYHNFPTGLEDYGGVKRFW